jgi:hypothetical protein
MKAINKKLIPKDKQKLYYIKWQDAFGVGGWLNRDELQDKVNRDKWVCEEVGWIIYEDASEIHLVGRRGLWTQTEAAEWGMYQRIPKAWILKRKLVTA